MSNRFQLVPAAYLIMRRGNRVLLQLRQNTGYMDGFWACAVAGHVEAGESVLEAAVREAEEEVGLTLDPAALQSLTSLHRTDGSDQPVEQRVDWFWVCDTWDGEPVIREPTKCADLRWFPVADLPAQMPPHERMVLDAWTAGTLEAITTYGFGTMAPRA